MLNKTVIVSSILLLFLSCREACYTSPDPIQFKFVNSQDENLLENGTLTGFAIQEEAKNGISVGVPLTKTEDFKVKLENVGSFNGTKNYRFFSTVRFFDFPIRSSNVETECDGFKIDQIEFDSIPAIKENDYYKIVLGLI